MRLIPKYQNGNKTKYVFAAKDANTGETYDVYLQDGNTYDSKGNPVSVINIPNTIITPHTRAQQLAAKSYGTKEPELENVSPEFDLITLGQGLLSSPTIASFMRHPTWKTMYRSSPKPKLNHHLQGEDAVKMFKEYGGTSIPKGSINGDQLRMYINEARERYGLVGNNNISDEEIAQALYKHTNELGKGSAAVNNQGEPQLLFRGDTKAYTQLKNHKLVGSHKDMDNEIGTLFTGEFPGTQGDNFEAMGSSRYMDGWYWSPTQYKWRWRGSGSESNFNQQKGYTMFYHPNPFERLARRGQDVGFIKAASTPEHPNDLNVFIVRTPGVRDASHELSVLEDNYLIKQPSLKTERFKWDESKGRIVDAHNEIDNILEKTPDVGTKQAIKEHYENVLQDAQNKKQGLLKSNSGYTHSDNLRDEHSWYSYFVLPDFNKQNAKHILPYDLRIPRDWSDPNIFRIAAPIGISLPILNNLNKK